MIYETETVAHCQYIATTARRTAIYALDALLTTCCTQYTGIKNISILGILLNNRGST